MAKRRRSAPRAKAQVPLRGVDGYGGGWYPIVNESFAGAWQAGVELSQDVVLANWAVFACQTLIAGDMGKMPLNLMERDDNDIWSPTTSSAFSPVLRRPNHYQTRQKFVESWILSKLSNGNAYLLKERDARGVVIALHVLDPLRVTPLVAPNGDVYYRLGEDDLAGVTRDIDAVPASEIMHDRMWCLYHPLVGLSPLYAGALAAGQGLKIQKNSDKFFGNMSRPSGILTAPGKISDDTAGRIKTMWEKNYSADNIGRTAVLGDDLKYQPMAVTAHDSQLVEQLRLTAEMVCTTHHVPAYKVGIGPTPTYQNAEVLDRIYYSDCLQTLIEAAEALLDEGLGLNAVQGRTLGVEFDLDGLIRMDSATQIKSLNDAVGGGWMKPNEARRRRNLKPVTGGDTPYLQQQNYSLAALDKRDRGDPFEKPSPPATPAPQPEEDTAAKSLLWLSNKFQEARHGF